MIRLVLVQIKDLIRHLNRSPYSDRLILAETLPSETKGNREKEMDEVSEPVLLFKKRENIPKVI